MKHKDIDVDGLDFTVGEPKSGGGGTFQKLDEDVFYEAELVAIEKEEAPFGPVLKWIFELTDEDLAYTDKEGNERRRQVRGTTSLVCNPKSKMYKWYSKVLGREPEVGEKVSLSNLIGTIVEIMIVNKAGKKKSEDGEPYVFANVDKIKRSKNQPAEEEEAPVSKKAVKKSVVKEKPVKKAKPAPKEEVEDTTEESNEDLFEDIF